MSRSPAHLMWADALALMSRAEQLRRDFYQPAATGWEPPVDLLETEGALVIVVALPGVATHDVELVVGGGEIAIQGLRRVPPALRSARVHRMELPQGRFERRVALPPGTFELSRRELADGCLTIVLRKVA